MGIARLATLIEINMVFNKIKTFDNFLHTHVPGAGFEKKCRVGLIEGNGDLGSVSSLYVDDLFLVMVAVKYGAVEINGCQIDRRAKTKAERFMAVTTGGKFTTIQIDNSTPCRVA